MNQNEVKDEHEHDTFMPGFRFRPTEEELVEFYLRRKVEGKRFSVELITFLDLYRYDPWELPALAAIGEKEWYFYVPRDRKYRNGDRPNRVTTSGYWKATGADRMIRNENSQPIGLKKSLVFYHGKAPKGIRSSWIMHEYRLPRHETERLQKNAEISICKVYKRAGVEDNNRSLPTRLSPSRRESQLTMLIEKQRHINPKNQTGESFGLGYGGGSSDQNDDKNMSSETSASSSINLDHIDQNNSINLPNHSYNINPLVPMITNAVPIQNSLEIIDGRIKILPDYYSSSSLSSTHDHHDLMVNNYNAHFPDYSQSHFLNNLQQQQQQPQPQPQPQQPQLLGNPAASTTQYAAFLEGLWDWSSASKDYSNLFK